MGAIRRSRKEGPIRITLFATSFGGRLIDPALLSYYNFCFDERTTAGLSSAFGAKSAPNFAQDDGIVVMQLVGAV